MKRIIGDVFVQAIDKKVQVRAKGRMINVPITGRMVKGSGSATSLDREIP